jgi:mRNA interferase YafQ
VREIERTNQFKKEFKNSEFTDSTKENFRIVVRLLRRGKKLPPKYHDHKFHGGFQGCRECHIKPDILMIYKISKSLLQLMRIGSHSNLYN